MNLADSEGGRFLRVGIDLGLESPLPTTWGGEKGPGVPTARIRDSILAVLTTWRSDPLLAPDGKQKLKAELVRGLRQFHASLIQFLIVNANGYNSTSPVANEFHQQEVSATAKVLAKLDEILRYDEEARQLVLEGKV